MAIICGLQVPGPVILPARYGLLTVATPVTPADGHWEGGITWDNELCTEVHSTSLQCPPVADPKIAERDFEACCADPFVLYGSYDCPPVGRKATDAFRIATERLRVHESRELERVFWTGVTDSGETVNPSLAFGNNTCGTEPVDLTVANPGLNVLGGLAVLESALVDCAPGGGVIHVNYGVAPFLAHHNLIYRDGDTWYTVTGQRLAFGAGYPGSGPENVAAAAGTTWMFATGPIGIWRSDIFLTPERLDQAVDRDINDVTVFAERVWAVGWSCCLFAINVTLDCAC